MNSQEKPIPKKVSAHNGTGCRTEVAGVLECDEIKQINLGTNRENALDQSLDDAVASEEEDDELEEETEVKAVADANHNYPLL